MYLILPSYVDKLCKNVLIITLKISPRWPCPPRAIDIVNTARFSCDVILTEYRLG